jgi:hypothetical protein
MFATYIFSAASHCCLGMETRRCVEFTGVELAGVAERVAPVEKAAVGRSSGEDGLRAGEGRETAWGARGRWSTARRGMRRGMGLARRMEQAHDGRACGAGGSEQTVRSFLCLGSRVPTVRHFVSSISVSYYSIRFINIDFFI